MPVGATIASTGGLSPRKEIVANVPVSGIMVPSGKNHTPFLPKRPLKE